MKYPFLLPLAALAACNQPAPQRTAATAPATVETPAAAPAAINTPRAEELLKQPGTQVLDVRTPVEYLAGHLEQARNLNVNDDDFAQQVAQLDTAKTYVLYCHSGKRSAKAADIMRQQGFRHVVNGGAYDSLKQQ